jgi:hypothetical protein
MHAICHYVDGKPDHLTAVDVSQGLYKSGFWKMSPEDALALTGGWIYLHETSAQKAYFVARVVSVGERDPKGKYELTVRRLRFPASAAWRGKKPTPSSYVSIVPASSPHELESAAK